MVMWRKGQDEDTGKGTSSTSNSTSNSTSGSISNQVLRLVAILNGKMTVREMMDVLGLRSRPMFFNYYLAPALKAGVIAMTQPDSPRSPTQKYYLTESGKSLIEKN